MKKIYFFGGFREFWWRIQKIFSGQDFYERTFLFSFEVMLKNFFHSSLDYDSNFGKSIKFYEKDILRIFELRKKGVNF